MVAQLATAQMPKWAEKAKKAVFSIVTYDKDNQIKGTGNGFYIDANGTALSDYSLFEGAQRAVIINADGSDMAVLKDEGIEDADAFIAVTDNSEANIFACLAAKRFGVKKTIAEIGIIYLSNVARCQCAQCSQSHQRRCRNRGIHGRSGKPYH